MLQTILGDPGTVSGVRESRKREKIIGRKGKEGERAPGDEVLPDQFQTASPMLAPDWAQKYKRFLYPISDQQVWSPCRAFLHEAAHESKPFAIFVSLV